MSHAERPPQNAIGQRVNAVAEDGRHRLLGNGVTLCQPPRPVAEARKASAHPSAPRVARLLVVGRQRGRCAQAGVARRDMAGQVGVPVSGGELVQRHHVAPPARTRDAFAEGS